MADVAFMSWRRMLSVCSSFSAIWLKLTANCPNSSAGISLSGIVHDIHIRLWQCSAGMVNVFTGRVIRRLMSRLAATAIREATAKEVRQGFVNSRAETAKEIHAAGVAHHRLHALTHSPKMPVKG